MDLGGVGVIAYAANIRIDPVAGSVCFTLRALIIVPGGNTLCNALVTHGARTGLLTIRGTGGRYNHRPLLHRMTRRGNVDILQCGALAVLGGLLHRAAADQSPGGGTAGLGQHHVRIAAVLPHIVAVLVPHMSGTDGVRALIVALGTTQVFKNMAVFLGLIVGLDHLQIMAGGSNILGAQIFQALGAVHVLLALGGTGGLLGYHCIRLGAVASAVRSNKFVSFFLGVRLGGGAAGSMESQ